MIGLREAVTEAAIAAHDPTRPLTGRYSLFSQRYGMPFGDVSKERASATGRGCRAVVAARLRAPGSEGRVLRALQLAYFTTPLLLDDDGLIREVLDSVAGLDADAIVGALDDPDVAAAYEADRAEARSAVGSPAAAQGRRPASDGPVRFTAPSVVFERDGTRLVAGGWQPISAYDVLLANLDPELERQSAPESPEPLFAYFSDGLTTAEVATLLAEGPDPVPDFDDAERALARPRGARRSETGSARSGRALGRSLSSTEMPGCALRRRVRHHRRYLRRVLGSGGAAAPERESLALLPSGPDAVRTLPVRGTRSSTRVRRPSPDEPSLGRRSAPHGADFGFREPLTPHLARPGTRRVAAWARARQSPLRE